MSKQTLTLGLDLIQEYAARDPEFDEMTAVHAIAYRMNEGSLTKSNLLSLLVAVLAAHEAVVEDAERRLSTAFADEAQGVHEAVETDSDHDEPSWGAGRHADGTLEDPVESDNPALRVL